MAVLARCLLHVVYEFQAFLNLFAKQALGLSSGMAAQVTYPSPNHFQCIRACCTTARSFECTSPLDRGRSFGEFVPTSCGGVWSPIAKD